VEKLIKHALDKQTLQWTENWPKNQAQRAVISDTKAKVYSSDVCILRPYLF